MKESKSLSYLPDISQAILNTYIPNWLTSNVMDDLKVIDPGAEATGIHCFGHGGPMHFKSIPCAAHHQCGCGGTKLSPFFCFPPSVLSGNLGPFIRDVSPSTAVTIDTDLAKLLSDSSIC